jgi:hypothetical protein
MTSHRLHAVKGWIYALEDAFFGGACILELQQARVQYLQLVSVGSPAIYQLINGSLPGLLLDFAAGWWHVNCTADCNFGHVLLGCA